MANHDKRRLRAAAFTKHLREQLRRDPWPAAPAQGTPLPELGPHTVQYIGAHEVPWAEASRGAGTGTSITRLHGAAKTGAKVGMESLELSLPGFGTAIGCEVARTVGPLFLPAVMSANRAVREAERAERVEPEGQATAVLPESWPTVVEFAADEQLEDTIIIPVVGDRVHYSRGSGYLVGLQGVVVVSDDGEALPSGLRYVQFDDEEWPTVVAVMGLDRM
ncbi:hypothetical protein SAMN02800687_3400 [Curtobacterium sp. UNCCL20]|uniref:hypothetical protein n=1 Tax=Curtobacterium sp. UNCCL20 TaxID=1502773 RepID=UPI00088F0A79|nr:hypothetical protein [Curtobacterium sp. UNCCL20]SDR03445.1 hypothetical protein SAMN02800687_3400 [Curtobacterium sp. UNCCL20]